MIYDYITVHFETPVQRNLVVVPKEGYTSVCLPFIGSYWSGLSEMIDEAVNQEAECYELSETKDTDSFTLPFDYEALCKKIATHTCEELLGLEEDEWEFLGVDMPDFYNYGDDKLWVRIRNNKMQELTDEFGGDYNNKDFSKSPICKKLIKELTPWDGINRDLEYSIEKRGYDRGIGGEIFFNLWNETSGMCISELIDLDKLQEDFCE